MFDLLANWTGLTLAANAIVIDTKSAKPVRTITDQLALDTDHQAGL